MDRVGIAFLGTGSIADYHLAGLNAVPTRSMDQAFQRPGSLTSDASAAATGSVKV